MFKISKIMCMHELTLLSSLLTCIFPLVSYLEKNKKQMHYLNNNLKSLHCLA